MWKIHKTLPGAQADVTPHLPPDPHAWRIVAAWPSIDVDDGSGDLPGPNGENGDQLNSAPGASGARAGAKHDRARLDHLDHLSPLDSPALDGAPPLASNGSIVAKPGAALAGTHSAAGTSDGVEAVGATVSAKSSPRRARGRQLQQVLSSLAIAAIILAAAVCIALTLPGAWLMVGAALIGLSIATQYHGDKHKLLTMVLGTMVGVAALDYLTWRLEMTNWAGWWIAVPLLAAEIFGALHTLGLQYTVWPRPQPQVVPSEDPTRRPIFIFIPTVNEGPAILAPTIQAACEARRRYLEVFPRGQVSIVVCNDGRVANAANWRQTEQLAHRLGALCITRTVGGGAKAGNLEHARRQVGATDDALVVIFDADQIAQPDFLLKTVPPFADPTVGWVQTGQYYRNLDQPVARWANDQQALFYRILCPGKAAHNAAFICGTNVVVRAVALDQIGGLPQDSVTEDFAASIQLHPTWRSLFITEVLATGLGPMDLPAYLKQQHRWAHGTLGVLRTYWPAILLPRRRGLRVEQRIQYLLACTHYLCGLRDLIYVVSPLLFLVTGIPAVRGAALALFLWHFVPYYAAAQVAFWYAGRRETGLRGIIIGFGSFPVLIQALFTVIRGRRTSFMVTAKHRRATRGWSHLIVYILALLCCFGGIRLALTTHGYRQDAVAISTLWVLYDVVLLASFLWLGIRDLRFQEAPASRGRASRHRRLASRLSAWRLAPGWRIAVTSTLALALSSELLLVSLGRADPHPVHFAPGQEGTTVPYLGLSLRVEWLATRPAMLQEQLGFPFTIIGRTQDIQDSFDLVWARRLAAHDQRPWITLQFGEFGANGTAPLDTSLPAIANGIQDANIQRWAQAIRTYGKPVYLTVLLHVDRNWSVSSAVANGGIPQDVPRAWEHVRSIFAAAGDTNVAWVWSPADPAHDQAYAPPENTIDVVLQSMIRYPGTPWPDPAAVLQAVIARHPTKPLFLEVSASGDPQAKAVWLKQVATAVASTSRVYALLYHEGAPDLRATALENTGWSLESDPLSLYAVAQWGSLFAASEPIERWDICRNVHRRSLCSGASPQQGAPAPRPGAPPQSRWRQPR